MEATRITEAVITEVALMVPVEAGDEEGLLGNLKEEKPAIKIKGRRRICWVCNKAGHYASNCPERESGQQETNLHETQEAEALYVYEVVFLNEDKVFSKNYDTNNATVWYIDNGASNHMTEKEFFSTLDEKVKKE